MANPVLNPLLPARYMSITEGAGLHYGRHRKGGGRIMVEPNAW